MKLSKRLRKWKANLTTQTPIDYVITLRADINGFADEVKALEAENAKLRDERARYEDLVRILDREWGIEASWDGLRKFWYVGLTENGMKERDALKAENEKLKKRLAQYELFREVVGDPAHEFASLRRELHRVERENAELVKRNEELQADVIRLFLNEVRRWIDCKQREMEEE